MKEKDKIITRPALFIPAIVATMLVVTTIAACVSLNNSNGTPRRGIILEQRSLTLTIGASEKLKYTVTPEAENQTIVWKSSDESVATVSNDGIVTAINFTARGDASVNSGAATGTAQITASTVDERFIDTITVTATTQALVDIMTLPPIKDSFSSYFMIGNIFNPDNVSSSAISNQRLVRHFNILTAENHMKPGNLSPIRNSYEFGTADRMVNAALASGFKVHGHTILWHQQNAHWMTQMARTDRNHSLSSMKIYITDVMTHFRRRVYSWDVLNEVFPDGVSANGNWKDVMRRENPWYASIGADFVYEGFLAARLADPNAILYYNDFNTDQIGKATMIRDMVRDVNQQYLTSGDKPAGEAPGRLLIEGIGMQEHHNLDVSMASVRRAINLFRPLGVVLSVSELDVLAQNWGEYRARQSVTNRGIMDQAYSYADFFEVYIENADIIERVTFWGVTDNQSWRSMGLPLLFDSQGRAKPAYYSAIGSLYH